MPMFTTWCCSEDHSFGDTMHITTVEAEDSLKAAEEGRAACANDWNQPEREIRVLGVAEGNVKLVQWEDEGLDLPAPQVLLSIKIDFDAWPGAPFSGGKIIEIDRETFDDGEQFEAAWKPEVSELLDGLAEDDSRGPMLEQIEKAVLDTLQTWEDDGKAKRTSRVLASGRYKLDGNGEPLRSRNGQEVFDENFDISVTISGVLGDDPDAED